MLPSEKAERWLRRILTFIVILIVLYILVWIVRFISGHYGRALEQRNFPPEARLLVVPLARFDVFSFELP